MTPYEDQLLCRYLDGRLTDEDKNALQDLLRTNAQARRRLRILATVTESISGHELAPKFTPIAQNRSLIPWFIAVAATIIAVVGWVGRPSPEPERVARTVNAADSFLALLVDEAGAKFASGRAPDDGRFQKGSYQLQQGAVHLRFSNGTDVVMNAPAAFDIDDAFHVRLHYGAIRAIVPPSGQGFTVATPTADYEDLGTEFALSVDPDTGVSALHVINGRVDAKHPESKKLISSVTEGQSVQLADDSSFQKMDALDLSRFPTPGEIGLMRWERQRAKFVKDDPDLIGYYPFIKSEQLINEAANPVTGDGQIHGARWVSGRWPGKAALLFDRNTDFVELNIPDEYDELSFAAWMKIDRFEFSHSAIFNSNGWERSDVHWQIHRTGSMWIGYHGDRGGRPANSKVIPTDQWIHVAGTISRKSEKSCVYLNGELAGSVSMASRTSPRPGLGRIGGWLMEAESDSVPIRSLRGKMDEFAIWKRALTESEVKELVEQRRPTALWPMGN